MPPNRFSPSATLPAPPLNQNSRNKVSFAPVATRKGHRAVLYGTGGIGKTTLACLAPGPVALIDLDDSLSVLKSKLEEDGIPIPQPVNGITDIASIRTALQSDGWDKISSIVIDSGTRLEELCVAHTLKTVKRDGGSAASSVEDYGYGKGYTFVFDAFLPLLGDLDRHVRAGRNVIIVAHDCTSNVPNPGGDDWIRYEPRLQNPASGKASIRLRLKEWADHVLFLGYDVAVEKEKKLGAKGKAQGSGTRTLYTAELPFCMAKSRTTSEQFDVALGESPWEQIFKS